MVKLDIKDKKLIRELGKNAKQPNTIIGRKIGLKSDVVQYRINRLEKNNVIKGYFANINIHKLGYIDFGLYISFSQNNREWRKKFIEFIANLESVTYFAEVGGNYDFLIGILAKDPIEFRKVLNFINKKFGDYINEKEVIIRISLTHFPRGYLLKNKRVCSLEGFGGELKDYRLNELDKKILYIFSNNARMKIIDIASKLKQSHSTIISRIKNLEKSQIITGYYPLVNSGSYGYQNYNLIIKTKNLSEPEEKELYALCKQNKNITWFIKTLGSWDYEIGIEVENQKILQYILNRIKEISKNILKIEFIAVFQTLKYAYPQIMYK